MIVAIVLAAGFAKVAVADEWGSQDSNTGAHPDPDPHGFCYFSSVSDDLKSGITAAEWNALDPAQANVNYDSSCNLSGSGETNVVWRQGNLANGTTGQEICEDYDGSYCDQYYLTVDLAEVNEGSNDERDEEQTACHELGHSVGLSHASNDCMMSGEPPADLQYRRYSDHHRSHINNWF